MRVGILYNPISGSGMGKQKAVALQHQFELAEISSNILETSAGADDSYLDDFKKSCSHIVVVGGDGTLCPMLEVFSDSRLSISMLAAGNESIFAKAFAYPKDESEFAAMLMKSSSKNFYYARAGGKCFFNMLSIGLDSQVVFDTNRERKAPLGNIGYLLPALKRGVSYRPPTIRLVADEKLVVDNEPGSLVIANHYAYAGMIAPVPEASAEKPLLSARFFPNLRLSGYLSWALAFALGTKVGLEGTRYIEAERFQIDVNDGEGYPVQADGEYLGDSPIEAMIATKQIRVSLPAAA